MEYFRDPKNQIFSDMAYRLGKISDQYHRLKSLDENKLKGSLCAPILQNLLSLIEKPKFEVSLDVTILQNLLTNCLELMRSLKGNEIRSTHLKRTLSSIPFWGLSQTAIEFNSFPDTLTIFKVLEQMRNSLSHPGKIDLKSEYPTTGYTTIESYPNISKFVFIASPDVRNNRPKKFESFDNAHSVARRNLPREFVQNDLKIKALENNKYGWFLGDKPYVRILRIIMTPDEIHELVIELSNYLAQPIQKNWDGETIARLVA